MKTAVKVLLRLYIGGEHSDEDSCESNIKAIYRGDNSDEDSCESNIKVLYRGR
jgi:hypothetical protein